MDQGSELLKKFQCPVSTQTVSSAESWLGPDPSMEEGTIERLEEKILELEGKIKILTGDIDELRLNAAGLALNFVHIDKCSEFLFSVHMG